MIEGQYIIPCRCSSGASINVHIKPVAVENNVISVTLTMAWIFGARWAGLGISETADHLGFFSSSAEEPNILFGEV